MTDDVWSVIVAAGHGSRFGAAKQYERLGDQRVLDWSLATARAASAGVVLVVAPEHASSVEPGADLVVPGGATRSASVRAGLGAVPADAEVIVVHDAARPLASAALFEAVVAEVRAGADAALPAVAVTDTVVRVRTDLVVDGVDRTDLMAVQTPQAFAASALREAHKDEPESTDDAGLVRARGGKVVVVPGDLRNLKLTRPSDLIIATALLDR